MCAWTLPAHGHARSVSYSSWVLSEQGASVRVRISLLELSRLGVVEAGVADPKRVSEYLSQNLVYSVTGEECRVAEAPQQVSAPEGWVHFDWRTRCTSSGAGSIHSRLLLAVAPSHLHFVRIRSPGMATLERVLSERDPVWSIPAGAQDQLEAESATGSSIGDYVRLGVEHILSGWDHLAFVVALILLATRLGEVARLVTGFTLAHSVTLAMAVLGVMNPETAAVEALIGFSIALVAAENTWLISGRKISIPVFLVTGLAVMALLSFLGIGLVSWLALVGTGIFAACHFGLLARVGRPAALRVAVAFAFGLIHGFGFAGVLEEMALPTERLAAALFGFNLGVEFGQLGVVALIWPFLWSLQRIGASAFQRLFTELASAAICGLGVYWFVLRAFV